MGFWTVMLIVFLVLLGALVALKPSKCNQDCRQGRDCSCKGK
jgi:uncharacterized membrane protein